MATIRRATSSLKSIAQRRGYATPAAQTANFNVSSSSSGFKLATVDEGLPTSAITVAIKAGSRYESQPGLAHVIKNFVFKNTNKRSSLRIIRETELFGGVLSSSLSREHLFLTAECMRGDEAYFAELLGDVLTQSKFAPHEYNEEVIPSVAVEYEQASQNPEVISLDLAHQLAFRKGLGNSLLASPHTEVPLTAAVAYARSSFSNPSGIAVLASGVDNGYLSSLVDEFYTGSSASFSSSSASAVQGSSKSTYYGGEVRIPITAHGGHAKGSLLVAFQGGNHTQPEYAVLRHLLGGESALKWTNGTSPLSQLTPLVGNQYKSVAKSFNLHYSDAGLFGFFISAPTEKVGEVASKSVEALKNVANGGVKEEELKRAIAKTKFAAASVLESRAARQELIGAQILENGNVTSLADAFSALDGVSAQKVQEAAKAALKSKPTVVAVGDTHALPWADELGL